MALFSGERLGKSDYEALGGSGDDTFIFDGTFGRAHYTDGGIGIDTIRIIAPNAGQTTAWEPDFTPASTTRADGIQIGAVADMIDNVESFVFDATERQISLTLSGEAARALAEGSEVTVGTPGNPVSTSPAIYFGGLGDADLNFTDGTDWSTVAGTVFDGIAYDGRYNATHDVFVFVADFDIL